ncbi:unnamed protein product [Staurois parvus]|uniref:Secreted protein n=1 Tax=Staurois parvus TaxID=386267 RepID=A0ABN9EQ06_9NEOB|nr:unnamed protein product [Staurois parvus]
MQISVPCLGAAATTYADCSSTILEQGSASVSGRNSAPSLCVWSVRNSAPSLVSVGRIVLHHWCQCEE